MIKNQKYINLNINLREKNENIIQQINEIIDPYRFSDAKDGYNFVEIIINDLKYHLNSRRFLITGETLVTEMDRYIYTIIVRELYDPDHMYTCGLQENNGGPNIYYER